MPFRLPRCGLPILLLHDLDPAWTSQERHEAGLLASHMATALAGEGYKVTPVPITNRDLISVLREYDPLALVVFNWCESLPGVLHSEPCIARYLDEMKFVYTGANSISLALSQDKQRVKDVLDLAGLPTPQGRIFNSTSAVSWDIFPAIVKPVNEHSSIGITPESVVLTTTELEQRIEYVLDTHRQSALVEEFIDGREFHVSLWGHSRIEMLPPVEMGFSRFADVHDRLCSYDAKFNPGSAAYDGIETILPAQLTPDESQQLEHVCQVAYRKVGCRDYGRIDVRLQNGVFYVLDVNPNADLSFDASFACAAEESGYSYGELCSTILRLAAKRHPALNGDQTSKKRSVT